MIQAVLMIEPMRMAVLRIAQSAAPIALFSAVVCAQDAQAQGRGLGTSSTPFDGRDSCNTSGIKGKVLPLPFGNDILLSVMAGYEHGFARRHSFGTDVGFVVTSGSQENAVDTTGVKHDVGNDHHGTEWSLFLNYRYYLGLKGLRDHRRIAPYLGLFARYGYMRSYRDPAFKNTAIKEFEDHRSMGALIGTFVALGKSPRFGLDMNIGWFYKEKEVISYKPAGHEVVIERVRSTEPGPRLGLNFYWWFHRRGRIA